MVPFGSRWALVGSLLVPFGSIWAPVGSLLAPFWCSWAHFCSPWSSIFSLLESPCQNFGILHIFDGKLMQNHIFSKIVIENQIVGKPNRIIPKNFARNPTGSKHHLLYPPSKGPERNICRRQLRLIDMMY